MFGTTKLHWLAGILFIIALVSHHTHCFVTSNTHQTRIVASDCDPTTPQCTNFSKCFANTDTCFTSNTTILFIPDTYHIETNTTFIIRNRQNVKLKTTSVSGSTLPPVSIVCLTSASFAFVNVSNLTISDIAFFQCGATLGDMNVIWQQMHSFLFSPNTTLNTTLFFLNIRRLTINNIHVKSSIGIGLMAINVLGGSNVQNSVFDGNASVDEQLHVQGGGNALFVFTDTVDGKECDLQKVPQDTLSVSGCTFSNGANGIGIHNYAYEWWLQHSYVRFSQDYIAGAGLALILVQTNYDLTVKLNQIVSCGNFAHLGANMFIALYEVVTNSSILIENSTLSNGNSLHRDLLWETNGGGLLYAYGSHIPEEFIPKCIRKYNNIKVQMNQVKFTNNTAALGGALSIWETNDGEMECCHDIIIHKCTFVNNSAEVTAAIYIFEDAGIGRKRAPYAVTLISSSFFNNRKAILHEDPTPNHHSDPGAVVTLDGVKWSRFIDCNFTDNQIVGIESILSVIIFSGTNVLSRNSGEFGGAMGLYLDAMLLLDHRSQLIVTDNHAEYRGGGIYISALSDRFVQSPCFYQVIPNPTDKTRDLHTIESKVYMRNNTAVVAGGTIYGGNLQDCIQFTTSYDAEDTFDHVFDTDVNFTDTTQSAITSSTLGPCLCTPDGKPDCSLPDPLNRTVFPGERFNISMIGVGQFNGIVPSIIEAETYIDGQQVGNQDSSRRSAQTTKLGRRCTNTTYIVHAENYAEIVLRPHKVINYRYFTKTIYVSMQECPLGFVIKDSPQPTCKCAQELHHHCNEEDGTIRRSGNVWLGHFSGSNLYHKDCPFDYCITDEISFKLNESEKQCAFNRIGILCGGCKEGLSLTLGASHCRECSNGYIALVVAFAFAGLLLVLLLFVCNITVTTGTISGLVFYANVVRINHAMFFPAGTSTMIDTLTSPLSIFIAWVNLDLGIETCFFTHMDGYAKTWLQFAFPVYIWAIAFAIIIATKYSSFLQKVWGTNAVPVLATLYLLSYAKLQRTIITALSCTWLHYNWGTSSVWLYDGNVTCFRGKHLALALVAIAMVVLFILPMMLLLLLARKLQAWSTHPALKWMNKLKPFLDAYQGPYKDQYRHWTGFMLLVQNLLFLAFALNMEGSPELNCLVTVIAVLLLLWFWGKSRGIYRSYVKNALECFYLMNLGVLAVSSLYIRSQEKYTPGKQHWISGVLVGVAFMVFTLILGFHIIRRARKISAVDRAFEKAEGKFYKLQVFLHQRFTRRSTQDVTATVNEEEEVTTVSHQTYELVITPRSHSSNSFSVELREALLSPDTNT